VVRELVQNADSGGQPFRFHHYTQIGTTPINASTPPTLSVSGGDKIYLEIETEPDGQIKESNGQGQCTIKAGATIPDDVTHDEEEEIEGLYHYHIATVSAKANGDLQFDTVYQSNIDFYIKTGKVFEATGNLPTWDENFTPEKLGIEIEKGTIKELGASGRITMSNCDGSEGWSLTVKDGRIIRMNATHDELNYSSDCSSGPEPEP
jgi:hypothetical protein